MKSRFDVVVHCSALSFEVSFYRAMDLKYRNNNGEINFIEPSRDRHRKTTRKHIWKAENEWCYEKNYEYMEIKEENSSPSLLFSRLVEHEERRAI